MVEAVITKETLRKVVKEVVSEQVEEFVRANELKAKELALMERVVRVEEELASLRRETQTGFAAVDKRFEAQAQMIASLQQWSEKRFEALQREMDKRFEALQREMDKRFEALLREMDKRFEALNKRFSSLQWLIGIGFTVIALVSGFAGLVSQLITNH